MNLLPVELFYYIFAHNTVITDLSSLEIARLFQTESYSFHFFNRSQVVSVISSATLSYTIWSKCICVTVSWWY